MKLLFFILVFMASCGKDSGDSGSSNQAETAKSATTSKPAITTSYYVSKEDELIACDQTTKGYLAYVKSKEEFMACLEAGWTTVNVKGKDGSSGKDGSNGKDGTPVSPNQWYDPITAKMWVMTTIITSLSGFTTSQSACTGSYRMPSASEIQLALTHGMKAAAQAMVNPPTYIIADDANPYTVNAGTIASSGQGAQFCIAK